MIFISGLEYLEPQIEVIIIIEKSFEVVLIKHDKCRSE